MACPFTSPAAFLPQYSDLLQTTNFSEPHYVGVADRISQQGGGLFTWIQGDTREEIWGLIFKSNQTDANGRWVRQDSVAFNPDWAGALHREGNALYSFLSLGYTQTDIQRRYSRWIPDISMNDSPDWAALQLAFKAMEQGYLRVSLPSGTYHLNRGLQLPANKKPNEVMHFLIEGNGAQLICYAEEGYSILGTMPLNQKMSQDMYTARRFHIKDLHLKGKNTSKGKGTAGIRIGGSFHSLIENIQLSQLDTGIILRHAMSCEIYRCNASGCFNVAYYLGSGKGVWEGATGANSGSNQSKIRSSRIFIYDGQKAGAVVEHSSECRVEDFTLDGGQKRHIQYVILFNTGGVTTVKEGYIKGVHGEAMVDSALIKVRGGGNALFAISDLFVQMPCTVVELETISGYAQVIVENVSYMPQASNFSNIGQGGSWEFRNVFERSREPVWKQGPNNQLPVKERIKNQKKL